MRTLQILTLSCFLAAPTLAAPKDSFWNQVSWPSDGVQLVGSFHAPTGKDAFVWILLHGLGSGKGEWDEFARKLAAQGDGILAYDLRGHGESTHNPQGHRPLSYTEWRQAGPGSQWDKMVGDLETAVKLIARTYGQKETRIGVGGASLGANVALAYASRHKNVPALILLSPGINYAGIASEEALKNYGNRPVFMAASPNDSYAYASVGTLAREHGEINVMLTQGPGAEHGVNMFKDQAFTQKLLSWIQSLKR